MYDAQLFGAVVAILITLIGSGLGIKVHIDKKHEKELAKVETKHKEDIVALKEYNDRETKKIQINEKLIASIDKLNDSIQRLIENDNQQDEDIEYLFEGQRKHDSRLKIIESIDFIKDRIL